MNLTRRSLLKSAAGAAWPGFAAAPGLTRPDWIAPGKLRWVWLLWEPIELYTRGGSAAGIGDARATGHWVRKWYERMHSDEILDKLASSGVNLVSTHFYKGFGLKAEAGEMARAADLTRRCHKRGIRVLGYHQFSTVIYETMLDEIPDLADLIQRKADGTLKTYGSASWRWMACPIHDRFIAYLKRVMDKCLLEAGMDGVEFDGTAYECFCDPCQAAFRKFCAERNPRPLERFGIPHFRHARIPPAYDRKDPLWQEWVRFRTDLMDRRLREMRAHVHGAKPGAAMVTYGECPGLWSRTRTRLLADNGDYLDLAVAESHDMPQVLDGELVTKVRHLKDGTSVGQVVLSTDWLRKPSGGIALASEPKPVELDMAECLACGGHVVTPTWALRSGDKRDGSAVFELPAFNEAFRRYLGFARDREELFAGSEPCANVWVYHSLNSLAFDHATAYNSVLGFEQALFGRIAWRIGKRPHLGSLGRRDVLILANQTCLAGEENDAIRAALDRGCGLIITGRTSECDENFRQWEKPALSDLYAHRRVRFFEKCPGATEQAAGAAMHAKMPAAASEILAAVRELAAEGLAAELEGGDARQPLSFVDVYKTPKGAVAHVIWYGDGPSPGFRLRPAPWIARGEATLYSPHLASPLRLRAAADGRLSLPRDFGRYCALRFA